MLHESLLDQQLFGIDVGDAIAYMGACGARPLRLINVRKQA
jgi:hypothetical protein